ncbi:hypothetical protein OAC22_00700 [bacterium]|nr:hypothetical protein [bacterium]
MTVSSTTVKNSYSGNGSTTQFAYGYKIFADSDLIVIIRVNSTGAETVKSLGTHYTVAGAGDASGGSITFTSGNVPASGQTVVIIREVPQTQAIDYIANDPFPAESHEEGLDRATMTTQQVQEELNRSLKISRTNTMTSTEFTVGATDRANKVLSFDSSGELSVTQELGTFKGTDATITTAAYVIRDIVKSTTTAQLNNVYICIQNSPIGTALTNTAYWSLLVDAVSAGTSATAAAGSATAAANSATASANSATASANSASAASTSETNAASSASTSSTQATNSANSATASANSASAAAATFDLFDDSYLGAKSSNPTVDNDGNALQDGALYFDTTNDVMKVYNLSTTTWLQLTPTVSNQNNINSAVSNASNINAAVANASNINAAVSNASNINSAVSNASNINAVAGISTAITNVNNNSSNINSVNANSANINLTAGSITNVNNVGGSIANVNTVATNLASVNNFGEVYRIASSAPSTSLNSGDLYFNTSTNVLNVYGASGWQNAGSSVNGTSDRFKYVASGTPTTFSGSDANGNTLSFDANFIDVYLNGIKMVNGTDVNVSSGSSIVFASAVTNGDIIEAVAFGTFAVASLTNTTVTGSLSFPDNIKAKFGTGNDLEIFHDGSNSNISDVGTGGLILRTDGTQIAINKGSSENMAKFITDGAVELYYDNAKKFETTSDGVAVTGGQIRTNSSASTLSIQGGSTYPGAKIQLAGGQASSNPGTIIFLTDDGNVSNPSERARIDDDGNFLVGKSALEYDSTAGIILRNDGLISCIRSGGNVTDFNRTSSAGEVVRISYDGDTVGSLQTEAVSTSGRLVVKSTTFDGYLDRAGTTIAKWMQSSFTPGADNNFDLGRGAERWKDIYLSGGAFLGGTGTANKLSDYEEGTFTPSVVNGAGLDSISYSAQTGAYTKIGNMVMVTFRIRISSASKNSSRLDFTGLPFTSFNGVFEGGAYFSYMDANFSSTVNATISLYQPSNSTKFAAYKTNGANFSGNDINSTSGMDIYITGFYRSA